MINQNSCGGSFAFAQDDKALRGHKEERSGDSMKTIQKGVYVYESPLLSLNTTNLQCHPERQRGIPYDVPMYLFV
jgi:hypothetical protein